MDHIKILKSAVEALSNDDELKFWLSVHRAECELIGKIAYQIHQQTPALTISLDDTIFSAGDHIDMILKSEAEKENSLIECKIISLERQYESYLSKQPKIIEDAIHKLNKIKRAKQNVTDFHLSFIVGIAFFYYDTAAIIKDSQLYFANDHNAFSMAAKVLKDAKAKVEHQFNVLNPINPKIVIDQVWANIMGTR